MGTCQGVKCGKCEDMLFTSCQGVRCGMFGKFSEGRVMVNEGDRMQGEVGLRWVRVKTQKQIPVFSEIL